MTTNVLFANAADRATQPTTEGQPSNEGFHPSSGGSEMQSGDRLLVEAYAAIWLCVLVFVFVMWRRTRALEERIEALDAAVRAAQPKPAAKAAKKTAVDAEDES